MSPAVRDMVQPEYEDTYMERLRELLLARGAALVGYADLSEIWTDVRFHLPRGISIAMAVNPKIVSQIDTGPTREYHEEYKRLNEQLNNLARLAAEFLADLGYRVKPIEATVVFVEPGTCAAPFQHKTVATRAGLGWIGKDVLLITKEYGSAVRLASVLTDAPLPVGKPINYSQCGECENCVRVCPGQAIRGVNWQVGMYREEMYDAQRCRETTLEQAGKAGIHQTICGMCIAVCPWTKAYIERELGEKSGPAAAACCQGQQM